MNSWRIADYASDSHAASVMTGGVLLLMGIAVGMALSDSKAIQGVIQEQLGNNRRPSPNPDPTMTILVGEMLKLLK